MRALHVQYLRQIFELSHWEGSPCDQIHLGRSQLSAGPCRSGQKPALWWHFLPQNLQLTSSSDQTVNVWCFSRQILMIPTWSWSHNHVHPTSAVIMSGDKNIRKLETGGARLQRLKPLCTEIRVKGSLFLSFHERAHPSCSRGLFWFSAKLDARSSERGGGGRIWHWTRALVKGDSAGKMRNCQQTEAHWRD